MNREPFLKPLRRIIVKIGTRVLSNAEGYLSPAIIASISGQVAALIKEGKEVVIVSSGAIAAGRALLKATDENISIPEKQALAAIGQPHLINNYQSAFDVYEKRVAQVLLTRDDLSHRRRYLNARNTLFSLLKVNAIPIVNENDTVMVEEIKFGDNDNLSARVAILADADLLILLTNAPGLCVWQNQEPIENMKPIPFVEKITSDIKDLAKGPADALGTGGMITKLEAALLATQAGLPTVIAQGQKEGVITDIIQGREVGTLFAPLEDRLTHKKHWIAHSLPKKGTLLLDDGAVDAIVHKGTSLLPSGIISVQGRFEIGEMVSCIDQQGKEWARGLTHYSSEEIKQIAGQKSTRIKPILGYKITDEIIHRDELVVFKESFG